jgi:di/tricarboxylate transporter
MADRATELRYAELLARVDLFSGLDRVTLAKLAARLDPVEVPHGGVVVREGDPGDAFYVIARGAFGVYAAGQDGGADVRLTTLEVGAPFGEMALLTNQPRSATIRAETEGEVLRLGRAHFLELVRREPGVALAIAATLSRRLAITQRPRGGAAPLPVPAGAPAAREPARRAERRTRRRRPAGRAAGGVLALLIVAGVWATPPPAGLPLAGWRALGTLAALVPLLAVGALPEGVLALLVPAVWVVGGVASPRAALSGFASPSWVLVVSVLAVGAAIASCGLLYRLALWLVARTPGRFVGHAVALMGAGVLVGPAVPNATGRVTLIAPALTELSDALGYAPRSRPAAGLAMAALIGFGQMAAVFLTSSTTAVLVFAVLPPDVRRDLTWLSWAAYAAPPNVLLLAGLVAAVVWLYRPRGATAPDATARTGALGLQRALLGPPTREERTALVVAGALVLGFALQPLHHVDPAWVAALALGAFAATRVLTADTLRAVNWSFALFFGTLASLSEVLASGQVDRWLGGLAASALGGVVQSPLLFVGVLTLLCFALNLVLRWQAVAPLVTIALTPVAQGAGISPLVVGIVAVMACNGFFLPYQSTAYLALYHGTEGKLFTHAQARRVALAYGALTLLAVCASVPAWRLLGLLP